jgi:FlaG/FlaF family flagellin (archaellin)
MKAVSSFIATVLLIAFVVGVAGIISAFVYNTISTQTEETKQTSEKAAACSRVFLSIDGVKTNSSLSVVNVSLSYTDGSENLYNFTVYVIDSGNRISSTSNLNPTYTESSPLSPGRKTAWSISTSGLSGTLFSVKVIGICQKEYPVSTTCESGNSCMQIVG